MAMINCPRCHNEIDGLWLTCPMCGTQTPSNRAAAEQRAAAGRHGFIQRLIVLGLVVLVAWGIFHVVKNMIYSVAPAVTAGPVAPKAE